MKGRVWITTGIWCWACVSGSLAMETGDPFLKPVTIRGEVLLSDALATMAAATGRTLVLGQGVEDSRLNVDINEVPVKQALDRLLFSKGYGSRVTEQELVVLAVETKLFRLSLPPVTQGLDTLTSNESSTGSTSDNGSSRTSERVKVGTRVVVESGAEKLSFWDDLEKNVRALLSAAGKVSFNRTAGVMLVTDTPAVVALIGSLLEELETRVSQQILVDVKVVEVRLSSAHRLGIDWAALMERGDIKPLRVMTNLVPEEALGSGGFVLSASRTNAGAGTTIDGATAVLKALETYGRVDVVSQPRVAMLNNTVANIQVGSTRSFVESSNVESLQSGTTVVTGTLGEVHGGVTLQIIGNITGNDVCLNVTPVVSSIDEIRSIALTGGGKLEAPETSMKSINAIVRLKAGQTAVIGGLITRQDSRGERSVPLLGRIPLIGKLFSYETRDRDRLELVVLISPRKG